MRPYLHKYISASPSPSVARKSKRSNGKRSKKGVGNSSSVTTSCDTFDYGSEQKYSEPPTPSVLESALSAQSAVSTPSPFRSVASESKVIFIDTKSTMDGAESAKLEKVHKNRVKKVSVLDESKYCKYWTVSIASTHSESPKDLSTSPLTMGFGICDATSHSTHSTSQIEDDESKEFEVSPYSDSKQCEVRQKYQSYHTKLKSSDDILIAFNTKSKRVTLWQNGKRFNKMFQLHSDRMYGFGIKLMCDDHALSIMADTGN